MRGRNIPVRVWAPLSKDFEEALLPALSGRRNLQGRHAPLERRSQDGSARSAPLSQKLLNDYQRHQLPDEVFYHTIDDIGRWASEYWSYSGKIGLAESAWLTNHLTLRLFQLGRLHFCMEPADFSAPALDLNRASRWCLCTSAAAVRSILRRDDTSFARARAFFPNTSRHMRSRIFSCHSWLLDETLLPLVGVYPIFHFFNSVQIVGRTASNAAARYVLRWDIQPDEIAAFIPQNRFQSQLKSAASIPAAVLWRQPESLPDEALLCIVR